MVHALAGKPAPRTMLVDVAKLVSAYYTETPAKGVSFGTSGHRGNSLKGTFNEPHIAAITQAVCEYRHQVLITNGPLFMGFDPHALSVPAFSTALEVLAANNVQVVIQKNNEFTPTPVISHMILSHNQGRALSLGDGIVITPSHNPPSDGGFKYNSPNGGPADVDATDWIQKRANVLMNNRNAAVSRMPLAKALSAPNVHQEDFITPFVDGLGEVIDMDAVARSGLKIGIDPLGGAGVNFWGPIADKYSLKNLEVVDPNTDYTYGFMTVDSDGVIRMDCSSPYAMARLIALKDKYDIAGGNDPDYDRHGIVDKGGLMNPNHYLSVAIWYLLNNRPNWNPSSRVGKTLVSSSMIDRVVAGAGRQLYEVPVGFKWFVQGLLDGSIVFGGEESAGASLLDMSGKTWTTDKDGFSMVLLAAEVMAKTNKMPSEIYRKVLVPLYGDPYYGRHDFTLADDQANPFKKLVAGLPETFKAGTMVAGGRVSSVLTTAPGNDAPIGGVKVVLEDGSWFAVRPSGTEPKGKLYIESFQGRDHWQAVFNDVMPKLIP